MGLGDLISAALGKIGLSESRVSRWLGRPCGCPARREKMNALGAWARRVLAGRTARAAEHLGELTDDGPPPP